MRSMTRFLLGTALALGCSSVGLADSHETPAADVEKMELQLAQMELRLDADFQKSASNPALKTLGRLAGPSTMDCHSATSESDLETCVVTGAGPTAPSAPAAIAPN